MDYYDDGYTWAEEHTTNSLVAYQDPVTFSSYESYGEDTNYDAYNVSMFGGQISIDHDDYMRDCNYDYSCGYVYDYDYDKSHNWYSTYEPTINYLAHNYMKPKLILYEPVECDTGYVSYHTQHSISYSQVDSGFNDPEFEEYDPTPYGGGYDIISEYGKPLPPSDQTCYPRSKPKPIEPKPTPKSESQPPRKPSLDPDPDPDPNPVPMPNATHVPLVEPKPEHEPKANPMELIEVGEREKEGYTYQNYGYDYPWPEYDHGNMAGVGYEYGYGKQVVQIAPSEYSAEVVDLCESIFGSWPCLARIRNQQMRIDSAACNEVGQQQSPWEECANYFFGFPIASYTT